jgi:hypothetical protein
MGVPRRAWTLFRHLWEWPRLIPVLSVLTVIALAGAAYAVFGVLAVDERQERDRIAADVASCTRGNTLRVQVRAIGAADQEMIEGILDVVLPASGHPTVDQIRADLQPVLARHRATVEDIELTDCASVTPGGEPTTTSTAEGP